jgi:glucosyl-dolichyl phosphate glucuronosyltransferase
MATAPLVTVAICTFNRAGMLDDALRSFADTSHGTDVSFEVLVVDNNSADATRAVVQRWAGSVLPVRYVFEGRQGLSWARNRAVAEAAGEWIWFVDDDVYFAAGWLEGAREGIEFFPQASMLAGRVRLVFEADQPTWLPSSLLPYYGVTAFGDDLRWLNASEEPVGANTAFRRSVFADVGPFRVDLGRVAHVLLSCEETDLVTRLRQRGHRLGYVPRAEVLHRVPQQRATMAWLRRRAYWGGISYVLTDGVSRGASRRRLIRQAWRRVKDVGRAARVNGLSCEDQIDYAWQLGTARQYLAEAARSLRWRTLAADS